MGFLSLRLNVIYLLIVRVLILDVMKNVKVVVVVMFGSVRCNWVVKSFERSYMFVVDVNVF